MAVAFKADHTPGNGGRVTETQAQFSRSLMHAIEGIIPPSDKTESPIESMMYLAMMVFPRLASEVYFTVEPQVPIGEYRVDFLVQASHKRNYDPGLEPMMHKANFRDFYGSQVIVECDGHEFHEKTKDQVEQDNKRDRELQAMGYGVLHFSGSSIWKNVFGCAAEVALFLARDLGKKDDEYHQTMFTELHAGVDK